MAGLHHCGLAGGAGVLALHLRGNGSGHLVVGCGCGDGWALPSGCWHCAAPLAVGAGVAALACSVPCATVPALPLADALGGAMLACSVPVARAGGGCSSPAPNTSCPPVAGGSLNSRCGLGVVARAGVGCSSPAPNVGAHTRCGGEPEKKVWAGCGGHGLRVADDQRIQAQVAASVQGGLIDHDIRHGVGWVCWGWAC